ncbi:hypothetical protein GCM10022393_01240 [Aquimarina addita]|uniref:Uncharacterized protein n=1 Tax=Aquimarina addita TaxID=870485 RepID=A0ABP7X7P5_9FLAO
MKPVRFLKFNWFFFLDPIFTNYFVNVCNSNLKERYKIILSEESSFIKFAIIKIVLAIKVL